MEVLYPRCAGLDVHAQTVVACVRVSAGRSTHVCPHRTVATTTRGLLELAQWLSDQQVTHVAMEATGVYWKPVWHVLEDAFMLILANAMHIRNIPGRKSDTNDATWIADLLALGLIRSSFVPPAPIQALRDLTRTRKQLVRELARHTQRIQKTPEDARPQAHRSRERHPRDQWPGDALRPSSRVRPTPSASRPSGTAGCTRRTRSSSMPCTAASPRIIVS